MDGGSQTPLCGVADQRHIRGGRVGADRRRLPGVHCDRNWMHRSAAGQPLLYPGGEAACNIVTRAIVVYGCGTWSVTLREERRLRVLENRVLGRLFGLRGTR